MAEIPFVRLCIKFQDGSADYYKVARNTNIKKLFKTYCKHKEVEYESVSFLYDGARLPRGGTIDELGIKDGDEIDAMTSQIGGGLSTYVV